MEAIWDSVNRCWRFEMYVSGNVMLVAMLNQDDAASMAGKIMNRQEQETPDDGEDGS